MENHSSASVRETPHGSRISRTNTIMDALRRRAQAILNDPTIDPESRQIIRYALETHDPWIARLVRRAEAGEDVMDNLRSVDINEEDEGEGKIVALAEMICRAGDEPAVKSAALVLLMSAIETATESRALAKTAKLIALSRCGELNYCGVLDAQIVTFENELLRE